MQGYFCSAQLPFASLLEALVVSAETHSSDLATLHKRFLPNYLEIFQPQL
jgi:hypothetical protein